MHPSREQGADDLTALGFTVDQIDERQGARARSLDFFGGHAEFVRREDPFPHAWSHQVCSNTIAHTLLTHLSAFEDWKVNTRSFYEARATALRAETLPERLRRLVDAESVRKLEQSASALFATDVELYGPPVAHKMTARQGVGIHTDQTAPGEETHRIVVFLSDQTQLAEGGHFVLLAGPCPDHARVVLPLVHNTGVAFQLGPHSYHAVTTTQSGARYSLVLSFRVRAT